MTFKYYKQSRKIRPKEYFIYKVRSDNKYMTIYNYMDKGELTTVWSIRNFNYVIEAWDIYEITEQEVFLELL